MILILLVEPMVVIINRFKSPMRALMAFKNVVTMEMTWFDNTESPGEAIGSKLSSDVITLKKGRGIVGDLLALIVQNITRWFDTYFAY